MWTLNPILYVERCRFCFHFRANVNEPLPELWFRFQRSVSPTTPRPRSRNCRGPRAPDSRHRRRRRCPATGRASRRCLHHSYSRVERGSRTPLCRLGNEKQQWRNYVTVQFIFPEKCCKSHCSEQFIFNLLPQKSAILDRLWCAYCRAMITRDLSHSSTITLLACLFKKVQEQVFTLWSSGH